MQMIEKHEHNELQTKVTTAHDLTYISDAEIKRQKKVVKTVAQVFWDQKGKKGEQVAHKHRELKLFCR